MSVRRILTSLVASVVMCGAASLAQAQGAAPKGAKEAPSCQAGTAAKPDGQAREAGTGRDRRCGRRGADLDRSVRHLGRLHGDAERQEGLLRAGQAVVIENQSAESSARSRLRFRLDASGGESRQRSFDHDRLRAEAGLGIDARGRRRVLRDVHPGRRALDQECRRGRADGRRHAQVRRRRPSRASRPRAPRPRTSSR